MAETNKKLHIVMFPWLAFGHMIPFLQLSKLMAQKGHFISFISTPRNIDRLPKLPPNLSPFINLVKLPLPREENLPKNAEATSDVPYNKVQYLFKAYDALQEPLLKFLETSNPDWIVHDFPSYWLGSNIAPKLQIPIPNVFFSIFISPVLCFIGSTLVFEGEEDYRTKPEDFMVPPKWIPYPSTTAFRYHEIMKVFDNMEADNTSLSVFDRFRKTTCGCDLVVVRDSLEFNRESLELLEQLHQKKVIPIGMLPAIENNGDDHDETWISIKSWLDKQKKGSVVYVAFGSEAKPSQDELTELALGLELSELPFFWVLKTRRGETDTEVIELPEGFEERTRDRGVVTTSWVPQLKILGHHSIGGMLTHSGWSSVVEALQFNRALILLTFLADQGLNNRVLTEKKIGYSIPRNEQDGSFTRNSVAESLNLVMVEEGGKMYRDKAKEMKGVFGDRDIQERHVDDLLDYLQSHRKIKKAP